MTRDNIKSELHGQPFTSFRLYLVSGRAVDVTIPLHVEVLDHALMVFRPDPNQDGEVLYDLISIRNIERLEQLPTTRTKNV